MWWPDAWLFVSIPSGFDTTHPGFEYPVPLARTLQLIALAESACFGQGKRMWRVVAERCGFLMAIRKVVWNVTQQCEAARRGKHAVEATHSGRLQRMRRAPAWTPDGRDHTHHTNAFQHPQKRFASAC